MISPHEALIYTMVLVSAADGKMPDRELESMGDMVAHLPVFREFDRRNLTKVGTAYALACDVAASDGKVGQEEARVLELIRYRLDIGRLPAAAIERGARARYMGL